MLDSAIFLDACVSRVKLKSPALFHGIVTSSLLSPPSKTPSFFAPYDDGMMVV
jgi:hypothetical protein